MGDFFSPDFGEVRVTPWYADNEMYCQEVTFSVPASEWSKFETSPLYREITELVRLWGEQTQDMRTARPEGQCTAETGAWSDTNAAPEARGSFWARVRRWFLMDD